MKKVTNKVPELRFKGFAGDWEQRKLGELANFLNGRAYKQVELLKSGKYPVLRVGNFNTNNQWYYSNLELPSKNYANPGDLLYTWATAFGPHVWNGPRVIYHYHIWKVELSSSLKRDFAYQLLQADQTQMTSNLNGSTMVHITKKNMENKLVSIPSNQEQSMISNLLCTFDRMITLHERKLKALIHLKTAYLQRLFPHNSLQIPRLRFRGFTDYWKKQKLETLLTISESKNSTGKYTQKDILAASLGTQLVRKHIFFGLRSTKESVRNYKVVTPGDIIYTKSPIKGYPNGIVRTNKSMVGIVPSLYCVYRTTADVDANIIQCYFDDKNRLNNYLYPLVNVGARNNVNITDSDFLRGFVRLPSSLDEQTRISKLIDILDQVIAVNQNKYAKLKLIKKSLLNKIFI